MDVEGGVTVLTYLVLAPSLTLSFKVGLRSAVAGGGG